MTYSYKEDRGGPMGSPLPKPALDEIQAKCGKGVAHDSRGEVKGYTSAGMGDHRRYGRRITRQALGIQFNTSLAAPISRTNLRGRCRTYQMMKEID